MTLSWLTTRPNIPAHKNSDQFMLPHSHIEQASGEFPVALTPTLILAALLYSRGWIQLRSDPANVAPNWRATSFLLGLFLVWTALGSPLAKYDHSLLTAHMVKHLILMTIAPAMILLGEPLKAFWKGMPLHARNVLGRASQRPFVHRFARTLTAPALCWTVSALTLIGWHLPALFTLSVTSVLWHAIQQAMFFGSGLLFWWPVVQPWPTASPGPKWSILLYLFLATLPCDILSGFLVFSDRVAYPVYFSAPRVFGFSVLEDQQCAAALMWTCITLVYLVPAAIISTKLLAPRTPPVRHTKRPQLAGGVAPQSDSKGLEVV